MNNSENDIQEILEKNRADTSRKIKTTISIFLVASGLYSLYSAQFVRRGRNTTYLMAAVAIGFGSWHLSKDFFKQQSDKNIQDEKLDYKEKL